VALNASNLRCPSFRHVISSQGFILSFSYLSTYRHQYTFREIFSSRSDVGISPAPRNALPTFLNASTAPRAKISLPKHYCTSDGDCMSVQYTPDRTASCHTRAVRSMASSRATFASACMTDAANSTCEHNSNFGLILICFCGPSLADRPSCRWVAAPVTIKPHFNMAVGQMNEGSAADTDKQATGCFGCFSGGGKKGGGRGDGVVRNDVKQAAADVKDKITPGNGLHGDTTTL
jgi:hypothetical protein